MSLVENSLSLVPEPKRRKIAPIKIRIKLSPPSSSKCDHWFVHHGICISCNATIDKTEGRSLDHIDKGIQMSQKGLTFTKRAISQISWLEKKKLHLVLDLDHTLLHTVPTSRLCESDKYLIEEAGSRSDLWRFDKPFPSENLIKLRPFVHEFLKEASEMFSMYVYTKGGYDYAKLVLELIDPEKVYFGDRVITNRESPGKKTLDLVMADERGTVIVDDKRSVWPDHKSNLLQIAKYFYFRSNEDVVKSKRTFLYDVEGKKGDESDVNGPLASVLRILKEVHKGFFSGKIEEKLDSVDVRPLLLAPSLRSKRKAQVLV
ncbi:unnamed protein product [Microthlaspi erraticum]|uniref:RNA polymerase II C-terminal domain phosphatase-like n=1 Tax=Microthlaspi erraticum TaxID=1685480 RepID=A0A6D2I975_9BRAS|nr:unnamed protein product [Microthlaspi erraticum]